MKIRAENTDIQTFTHIQRFIYSHTHKDTHTQKIKKAKS